MVEFYEGITAKIPFYDQILLRNYRKFTILRSNFMKELQENYWEHSGSMVECLTREGGAADGILTGVTALWSLSKTHLS